MAPHSTPIQGGSAGTEIDLEALQSGVSGTVAGPRLKVATALADAWLDARLVLSGRRASLARAAGRAGRRSVLVVSAYRPDRGSSIRRAVAELRRSIHDVRFALGSLGAPLDGLEDVTFERDLGGGKFENLNRLLAHASPERADCVIVVDDDVELPAGFLDSFLFLAERFGFRLAQPALTRASHGAWAVCRRQGGCVARRTRFVEIGPVTAFRGEAIGTFLPFPGLRMGWGLDLHWAAVAAERGWPVGIVDSIPVKHELRPAASGYDRREAEQETRAFLAGRPHITRDVALQTVDRYRRW